MGYDKDGHVVYQRMGNGTVSVYSYDPRRMHLSEMGDHSAGPLMHNTYTYDKVDNITSDEQRCCSGGRAPSAAATATVMRLRRTEQIDVSQWRMWRKSYTLQ